MGIKMKELATEGIKISNSLIIDVKEESISNIHNLMNDVVVCYQQAFAHKAQAFLNSIGPNTSVNRPLPAYVQQLTSSISKEYWSTKYFLNGQVRWVLDNLLLPFYQKKAIA